jgi:hypothetical protein
MWPIFNILYRRYCRAHLSEMRKFESAYRLDLSTGFL